MLVLVGTPRAASSPPNRPFLPPWIVFVVVAGFGAVMAAEDEGVAAGGGGDGGGCYVPRVTKVASHCKGFTCETQRQSSSMWRVSSRRSAQQQ